MDWQQAVSLIVVAVTAVLLGRSEIRRRRRARNTPCGVDCGCSVHPSLTTHEQKNAHA